MTDNKRQAMLREKRFGSLRSAANATKKFRDEVTEKTDPSSMTPEQKKHIIYLNDKDLLDDPDNDEIYGSDPDDDLVKAMERYGFQGVILAYPVKGGRYMIESGHRRRAAARKAGIKEYCVFVTEPPKSKAEQKMRLLLSNLHSRKLSPMRIARIAQNLYETHRQIIEEKRAAGTLAEDETTALNVLVAEDLEMDDSTVARYRALLKLVPHLQELADSGLYSWSDLSKASPLDETRQEALYERIISRAKQYGPDSVTRKWLQNEISILKADAIQDPAMVSGNFRAKRNSYSAKSVVRCSANMREILSVGFKVKEEEKESIIGILEQTRADIDSKIAELKS